MGMFDITLINYQNETAHNLVRNLIPVENIENDVHLHTL